MAQSQEMFPVQPHQLLSACGHSVGKQRDHNEDAFFSMTTLLLSGDQVTPFGIYMMADGMGGHMHGEIASEIAIRTMASHIIRKVYLPLYNLNTQAPGQSLQEMMQEGVQSAHQMILKEAGGGGTTLTCVLLLGDQMTIAHVGDSRAYIIQPGGRIEALTRDHTLVKRLEELGQITTEEAAVHPQRSVLYRALGQGETFDAEVTTSPIPGEGYLMVCSDGLWGEVPEQVIYEITTAASSPSQACQQLVEAANAAGGPDNISVILIRLPKKSE